MIEHITEDGRREKGDGRRFLPSTIYRLPFTVYRLLSTVYLFLLASCILPPVSVFSSPFLKLPVSARGMSLGGGYVAGEDLSVVEYNPAGVMTFRGLNAEFSYMKYFEDTIINGFAAGYSSRKFGFALGYKGYSVEDIARDALGDESGKINHSESAINGALALLLTKNFSAGFNIKSLSRKISDESISRIKTTLSGVVFDIGLMYTRGDDYYGVAVSNFGGEMKFDYAGAVAEKPPLTFSLGGRHNIRNITGMWQVLKSDDNKRITISTALDYNIAEHLSLRGGVKYQKAFDVSFGAGFRWSKLYLDYAVSPHVDFGLVHNISVGVRF